MNKIDIYKVLKNLSSKPIDEIAASVSILVLLRLNIFSDVFRGYSF